MATIPTCQRCESTEPAKRYNPRDGRHPDKRVHLCGKCAAADPRAVLDPPVSVPEISPVVPGTQGEVTQEADASEPTTIATPKDAPPAEKTENPDPEPDTPVPEPTNTEGSIPRLEIVGELQRREGDIAKLRESHQALLAKQQAINGQLSNTLKLIAIQQGAAAQLRRTLGIVKE